MAEDEIRKHAKAAIRAIKEPGKNWKHRLGDILLEILIIIFAVSISIWFHNWAESWKDRTDEKEFLTGLKGDLQADLVEMKSDRASYERGLRGVSYFEQVGGGTPLNMDSLSLYMPLFFGYTQIDPRVSRFEALKGSGRFDIIRNKKLLLDITDLYTKDIPAITTINIYSNDIRENKLLAYVTTHIQLEKNGDATNWQDMLRTSEMRVLIKLAESAHNCITYYSAGIAKSEKIIKEIDQELDGR